MNHNQNTDSTQVTNAYGGPEEFFLRMGVVGGVHPKSTQGGKKKERGSSTCRFVKQCSF